MPVEILLPKLGLTMEEAEIIEWCKQEGDPISSGDVLYVLETEKINFEFEAPKDGILGPVLVAVGESAAVGSVVAYVLEPGENIEGIQLPAQQGRENEAEAISESASSAHCEGNAVPDSVKPTNRARATPLAKKLARESEVDLSALKGSGPSGRIIAADVLATSPQGSVQGEQGNTSAEGDKIERFSPMRRTIAKNMLASKLEAAQTYMSIDLDASAIVQSRETFVPMVEKQHGVRLTITDIILKICGNAILSHPIINTRWTDEGVQYLADVHMGMALALDKGLLVPVIRDINQKNLAEVALDRSRLISLCRNKQFSLEDITGSTFTLSTLGAFGIDSFTSNINLPESAILAVGAVKDCAVVVDGEIRVQATVNVTLSYDHRHIDGADAARFMQTLKSQLEAPEDYLW